MKEEIKSLRVQIDGLAQLTKELKPCVDYIIHRNSFDNIGDTVNGNSLDVISTNSKAIVKAVDSLYLAKAWLGKVLGELGVDSPYKSGYKTKEDIEPTADVAKLMENEHVQYPTELDKKGSLFIDSPRIYLGITVEEWAGKSHIEKVDWLRTEIEKLVKEIKGIYCVEFKVKKGIPKNIKQTREFSVARTNAYTHLSEARFWLGWELERIKTN